MKKVYLVSIISMVYLLIASSHIYAEEDYSYLDDMSINQLRELDAEIHKRLPMDNTNSTSSEVDNGEMESTLLAEGWEDITLNASNNMTFYPDGSVECGSGYKECNWRIDGNKVVIEGLVSIGFGTEPFTKAFVFEEENDISKLVSYKDNAIFVRASDYEKALNSITIPDDVRLLSYDEMLDKATDIDYKTIIQAGADNRAQADEKYVGKCYRVTGPVERVEESSFTIHESTTGFFTVFLTNKEDLLSVPAGTTVTVVGKITDAHGTTYTRMKNAYIVR